MSSDESKSSTTPNHKRELSAGKSPLTEPVQSKNETLRPAEQNLPSKVDDVPLRAGDEPIPGYVLVNRLGRGGYGEVWKALAPGGFAVALKFVSLTNSGLRTEQRSLELIKTLRHPNLISIVGSWVGARHLIIAMELADKTLLKRFEESVTLGLPGIPRDELLEYFYEAAKGIDFLNQSRSSQESENSCGVQHRDIKPENILLVGNGVKVGDFGLVRMLQHTVTNHTGSLTANYAAPEFFEGHTFRQSDQYSLAVTYYHLRTGEMPFVGNLAQVMYGHMHHPPNLSKLPPEEQPAVARALSKKPHDRWPSCLEFVAAIRADIVQIQRPVRRSIAARVSLAVGMLGLVIVGGANAIGWLPFSKPEAKIVVTSTTNNESVDPPSEDRTKPTIESTVIPNLPEKYLEADKVIEATTEAEIVAEQPTVEMTVQDPIDNSPQAVQEPTETVLNEVEFLEIDANIRLTSETVLRFFRIERPTDRQELSNTESPVTDDQDQPLTFVMLAAKVLIQSQHLLTSSVRQMCDFSKTVSIEMARGIKIKSESPPAEMALKAKIDPVQVVPEITSKEMTPTPEGQLPREILFDSTGMKLVLIPAGEFLMGSSDQDHREVKREFGDFPWIEMENEQPQHRVKISRSFYMGKYEVSLKQFLFFYHDAKYKLDCEKDAKGGFGYDQNESRLEAKFKQRPDFRPWSWGFEDQTQQHPVVNISWNDATAFCEWLSKKEGKTCRLPTEAEWEYACRAGTKSRHPAGNDSAELVKIANTADQSASNVPGFHLKKDSIANFDDKHKFSAPVGSFGVNNFGLHDMIGNVWEWCEDVYDPKAYQSRGELTVDPLVKTGSDFRVIRGGSWEHGAFFDRSTVRGSYPPTYRRFTGGFRVVCTDANSKPSSDQK